MKVHDSSSNSVTIGTQSSGRTEAAKGGRSGASRAPDASGQDRISLSDLGSVVRAVSGDTPERTQRISQLTALYKSGNYHPDAAAVSRSMVNDATRST